VRWRSTWRCSAISCGRSSGPPESVTRWPPVAIAAATRASA
jgi:hypothetical protein